MNPSQTTFKKYSSQVFIILLGIILNLGLTVNADAQTLMLEDKPALDSIKKSVDLVYNFQFEKAEATIKKLKPKYGNHPAYHLFFCIMNFWKLFPIGAKPKEYQNYIKSLNYVISLSEKLKDKYPKSPEPEFYNMMANLILARHQSEEGEYIKAVNATRKGYGFIKKGFEWKTTYPEFYLSTGLYNYYRIAFPENHPLYKSFTVFFPDGNKAQGIKELEIASTKSLFAKVEALVFLSMIFMRDEYNIPQAIKYATVLHETYPSNWMFSVVYAECLLELKKPELTEPIINALLGRQEVAALLGGYYLKGLYEKTQGNVEAAKWSFQKAIMYGKTKDRLTKGYLGLSFNELAKIAKEEGKRDWTKKYFRQALDNCSFKKVKMDAKAAGF